MKIYQFQLLSIILCLNLLTQSFSFDYEENLQYKDAPNEYLNSCRDAAGKIITESYTGVNGKNSLKVYLPFGYDEKKQYNIFYLIHGGGENESTIFGNDVNIQNILDHLIKNGDMEPMIVVTPTFTKATAADTFWPEFRKDVVPFVEGKYKTYAESTSEEDLIKSRRHRGIGGFSMGGGTVWAVFENCLDYVAYYMPLSGSNWHGNTGEEKTQNCITAIKKFEYTPRDYFIFAATGSDDMIYEKIAPQIEAMKKETDYFVYTSDFSKGNLFFLVAPGKTHWWGYVKHYVYLGLPYFFHE